MDPALLREQELFKKRAISTLSVEKPAPLESSSSSAKNKPKVDREGSTRTKHGSDSSSGSFKLKAMTGSTEPKFGLLAKIVNYLKTRYRRGDTFHLTLDEILDETKLLDIDMKQKMWLINEALPNNPKIEVHDGKYVFKPKYPVNDKESLLRLLERHNQLGLGGVFLEDVAEGLPNAHEAVRDLGDQIIIVTRSDKKKILFYNEKDCMFKVDEEFKKLWHSVRVDSMDEERIEAYLKRQSISSMKDTRPKKLAPIQKRKTPVSQKKKRFKAHSDHLADVLEDYSQGLPSKK